MNIPKPRPDAAVVLAGLVALALGGLSVLDYGFRIAALEKSPPLLRDVQLAERGNPVGDIALGGEFVKCDVAHIRNARSLEGRIQFLIRDDADAAPLAECLDEHSRRPFDEPILFRLT